MEQALKHLDDRIWDQRLAVMEQCLDIWGEPAI